MLIINIMHVIFCTVWCQAESVPTLGIPKLLLQVKESEQNSQCCRFCDDTSIYGVNIVARFSY
jgi:hypothetical protein